MMIAINRFSAKIDDIKADLSGDIKEEKYGLVQTTRQYYEKAVKILKNT